jgi:hypothetical protein
MAEPTSSSAVVPISASTGTHSHTHDEQHTLETTSTENRVEDEVARRQAVMTSITNDEHPYSSEEDAMIARGMKRISEFVENKQKQKVSN